MSQIEKMFYEWSDEQVDSEVIRNAYQRLENEVKTKLGIDNGMCSSRKA